MVTMQDIISRIKGRLEKRARIVVGLAGAQGSGKSTLACRLCDQLKRDGVFCVVVSLDDFYLTKSDRSILGRSVHPLLATRGVPGTHDTALLLSTISQLLVSSDETVIWPAFSKKLDDRSLDEWNTFRNEIHLDTLVIILEGWCVGCADLGDFEEPENELERIEDPNNCWRQYINERIRCDYAPIWALIDVYIFLRVPQWSFVKVWRLEQAIKNGESLSDFDIDRFIQFFERISKRMLESFGRMNTDIIVFLGDNHSIRDIVSIEELGEYFPIYLALQFTI